MSAGEAMTLPSRSFGPQSRTDIVRYQGASGDFNPVHHDDAFARSGGLPGVVSVGMLQAGYLGTYCAELFGAESVHRIAVRFQEIVEPGETLVCTGQVVSVDEAGATAELALAVTKTAGGVAVRGEATVTWNGRTP